MPIVMSSRFVGDRLSSLPVMVTAEVSPSVRLWKGTPSLESGSRAKAGALSKGLVKQGGALSPIFLTRRSG